MASVNKLSYTLGALSGASGSSDVLILEQLTVDHVLFVKVADFSTTTLTVKVMTSHNGSDFAQISSTNITANGNSLIAVTTPLTHVRIDWTMAGGAQTATVAAVLSYDKRR